MMKGNGHGFGFSAGGNQGEDTKANRCVMLNHGLSLRGDTLQAF